MAKNKSSISNADSYRRIGEFWDDQDLGDYEEKTQSATFEVQLRSSSIYVPLEKKLAEQLRNAAENLGLSPEALLSRWVEEKIAEESRQK
jgi:predicted DNA binding CopG/RHH family protein